jgi:formimidoylglutamate deiminase
MTVLVPEVVIDQTGVHRDLAVILDADSGIIDGLISASHAPAEAIRLGRTALAPGFVNCHSHAFQRDLRGVVERVSPDRPDDDFWTWREAMYAAAGSLEPDAMFDVARRCYEHMRRAGYTTVGEFHYVHHAPDGTPYDRPNALAEACIAAAADVGLRIVLLLTAYERGGVARFRDPSVDAYLERLEELRSRVGGNGLVEVGAAPHSVRAISATWLQRIGAHCSEHGLVLHIHADEQPREIDECLAEHGCRPVELIERCGALTARTTIVHGTHCDAAEIELLGAARASVCVCPTTEANLGDGYAPVRALLDAGVSVCIGSDSNTLVDPLVELRELEAVARRTALRRNVLVRPGDPGPAPYLLACGWEHGARSLGRPAPTIEAGAPADLVALDLDDPEIAGVTDEHLPAAIVMAGTASLVTRTWVAGR